MKFRSTVQPRENEAYSVTRKFAQISEKFAPKEIKLGKLAQTKPNFAQKFTQGKFLFEISPNLVTVRRKLVLALLLDRALIELALRDKYPSLAFV